MRGFRTLKVWHKAHQLVLEVYRATAGFPNEERFGLTSQLRRAAASVPTNIAEGCGRSGGRELRRFLSIAAGSACETEYLLLLASDLGFLAKDTYQRLASLVDEVEKMLTAFGRRLDEESPPGRGAASSGPSR